jgi:hypothetical protein
VISMINIVNTVLLEILECQVNLKFPRIMRVI